MADQHAGRLPRKHELTTDTRLRADTTKQALYALLALPINRNGDRLAQACGVLYGDGPGGEFERLVLREVAVDLATPLDADNELADCADSARKTLGSALGELFQALSEESAVGGVWVDSRDERSQDWGWSDLAVYGPDPTTRRRARARAYAYKGDHDFEQLADVAGNGDPRGAPIAAFTELSCHGEPVEITLPVYSADGDRMDCRVSFGEGLYGAIRQDFGAVMGDLVEEGRVPCGRECRMIGQETTGQCHDDATWRVSATGVVLEVYNRERGEDYRTSELDWPTLHEHVRDAASVAAGPSA